MASGALAGLTIFGIRAPLPFAESPPSGSTLPGCRDFFPGRAVRGAVALLRAVGYGRIPHLAGVLLIPAAGGASNEAAHDRDGVVADRGSAQRVRAAGRASTSPAQATEHRGGPGQRLGSHLGRARSLIRSRPRDLAGLRSGGTCSRPWPLPPTRSTPRACARR